jgi:malonate transporter and related proteins
MLATALAIAPVFLLICTGYALRRGGIPSEEFWNLNDRLVYFVLMPALFFVRISEADLSGEGLLRFAGTLYAGFFAAILFGVAAALWLARGGAVGTSVIQGAGRFNTFVALAVAEALYGAEGLQLAVLGAALLVPVVNLTVVSLFAVFLPRPGGRPIRGALVSLGTNPLILSILAAIGFNAAGLAPIPVVSETLSVLGQAALPIMLLCVGASLKLRGLTADLAPVVLAAFGKLAVFPLADPRRRMGPRARAASRRRRADLRGAAHGRGGLHALPPARRRRAADGHDDHGADTPRLRRHAGVADARGIGRVPLLHLS